MSIRHGLLALLERGPRYGSQLRTEFESRTGSTWPLNVGQVYTTLARLERDGLVAGGGGGAPRPPPPPHNPPPPPAPRPRAPPPGARPN
ncbi:helix-turn-helix transcriptional regulator, partial [Streptomyces racemochromogenes]